jgi:hypothetical protein
MDYQTPLLSFGIALITTLVTVAFTKYFESKSIAQQHSNELRKIYLEKKISASECIISTLVLTSATFHHLQLLLSGINEMGKDSISDSINESLDKTVAQELKKIQEAPQIAYAVQLYYNVDDQMQELLKLETNAFTQFYAFRDNLENEKISDHIEKTNSTLKEIEGVTNKLISHIRTETKNFKI